jgi:RNA polymerase sigma factor (sigma-70 family)
MAWEAEEEHRSSSRKVTVTPEQKVLSEEINTIVGQSLSHIQRRPRQAYRLRYEGDHSIQHIAAVMGITPRVVRKYIAKAHAVIAQALISAGFEIAS